MTEEPVNPSNAEIRNHIEYSLKILVSIFDEKLMNLESNISNLNSKIEMMNQRIDFLERTRTSTPDPFSAPTPIKQDNKPKKQEKSSSSLSDALKLIQE
jgi:hypothetical protein